MRKKFLAVDQDQVLADLNSEWVKRYNIDFNDTLTSEDLTEWNWGSLAKCGNRVYSYLDDQKMFEELSVIEGSQDVLKKLSEHYEVIVVTAVRNYNNISPKAKWLSMHFPFISDKNYVFTRNKATINADWLIDDKPSNLENFIGCRILFDAPHNRKEDRFIRMKDWYEIERFFENNFIQSRKLTDYKLG